MILSIGERALLNFLISKGAATERGCWHRQKNIAKELVISVRTLQRWLKKLETDKLITVKHRQSTTNLYFVNRVENTQGSFDFSGNRVIGIRQNGRRFYRTEALTPKGARSPSQFSNSESEDQKHFGPLSRDEILHPAAIPYVQERGAFAARMQQADNPQRYQAAVVHRAIAEWEARKLERKITESVSPALEEFSSDPELEEFMRQHDQKTQSGSATKQHESTMEWASDRSGACAQDSCCPVADQSDSSQMMPMKENETIADMGSIPIASTDPVQQSGLEPFSMCVLERDGLDRRGRPGFDAVDQILWRYPAGDYRNSANHKGQSRHGPADGCLNSSEAAQSGSAATESPKTLRDRGGGFQSVAHVLKKLPAAAQYAHAVQLERSG